MDTPVDKAKPKVVDKAMQEKLGGSIIETVERVEDAYNRLNIAGSLLGDGHTAADVSVDPGKEFDVLLSSHFAPILFMAHKIGGRVEDTVYLIYTVLSGTRSLIGHSYKSKKPGDAELVALLKPFSEFTPKFVDAGKQEVSPQFASLHSILVGCGSSLTGWLSAADPATFIREKRLADVEAHLPQTRTQSDSASQMVECAVELLRALEAYAYRLYKSGLHWSGAADPPTELKFTTVGSQAPLAFLAKGTASGKAPHLDEKKKEWNCEFYNYQALNQDLGGKPIVLFYCTGSTFTFKGKSEKVTLDGCCNTTVQLDDNVSILDIQNCTGVEVTVNGSLLNLSVASTKGCRVVLASAHSSDAEISAIATTRFVVAVHNEEGNLTDVVVPSVFKHAVAGDKATTTPF